MMPEKRTIEHARQDKREGKAPTTQAGEFIREEMHHIREGKHGARSTKQAIAIGLSKARRAGVKLPPPKKGKTTERTRKSAERAYRKGQSGDHDKTNPRRSKAITNALKRAPAPFDDAVQQFALALGVRDGLAGVPFPPRDFMHQSQPLPHEAQ
jgi:uncharacterized protein DUF6496